MAKKNEMAAPERNLATMLGEKEGNVLSGNPQHHIKGAKGRLRDEGRPGREDDLGPLKSASDADADYDQGELDNVQGGDILRDGYGVLAKPDFGELGSGDTFTDEEMETVQGQNKMQKKSGASTTSYQDDRAHTANPSQWKNGRGY